MNNLKNIASGDSCLRRNDNTIAISILGATGSIGTQTLDVVRRTKNSYTVLGLSTHKNIQLLEEQADEFGVKDLCVFDRCLAEELQKKRADFCVVSGENGLIKLASLEKVKTVVVAVVGRIGLEATLAAIKNKKDIALANKETLVVSGIQVMEEAKKQGVEIRPIDSEHSAIQQCLKAGKRSEVKKIWLTASGGPFRNAEKWPKEKLESVTVEEALNHPTWKMGKKITIDSATLANKGLEFIEAVRLFDLRPDQIEVIIHPQSIIHSAVEFIDGSIIAEMGKTDMRRCIAYALSGEVREDIGLESLDLFSQNLFFEKPDRERFHCLAMAEKAVSHSEEACAVFNDVNEEAVAQFLNKKISFIDIAKKIEKALLFVVEK